METLSRPGARFDRCLVDQYRGVLGEGGATQLVELFVRTLEECHANLQTAVAQGDVAEVNRVGHRIKGMASAVGAVPLAECGLRLQHACADDVRPNHARFLQEAARALADVGQAWTSSAT
jgi:HPt (histidine-containing phosphotransfer) domain-containing protein